MSFQYDNYLYNHIKNVKKAHAFMMNALSDKIDIPFESFDNVRQHDSSKYSVEEYAAYDAYFYGGNRSKAVVDEFNKAWLHHIHKNPHHWQHWVLIEDDPKNGTNYICVEMPKAYAVEMIADWWSFSIGKGEPTEIFNWYAEHKDTMKLHKNTRNYVESILDGIKSILENESVTGEMVRSWLDC